MRRLADNVADWEIDDRFDGLTVLYSAASADIE